MESNTKQLYEKMIDAKRFAIILLAVGSFFYIGTIIPTETKITSELYVMIGTSLLFLIGSGLLFIRSKQLLNQINELDQERE